MGFYFLFYHVDEFNKINVQLTSIDATLEDEDKTLILFSSLPTFLYGKDTTDLEEVTRTLPSNELRKKGLH